MSHSTALNVVKVLEVKYLLHNGHNSRASQVVFSYSLNRYIIWQGRERMERGRKRRIKREKERKGGRERETKKGEGEREG